MYKWMDENGTVTYSNTPPVDRTKVKEFTKVEDINTVPTDKRAKDAQAGNEKRNPDSVSAKPDAATAKAETSASAAASGSSRPLTLVGPDASTAKPEPTPRRDTDVARSDTPRAAATAPGLQPEAAQDPCLRSADPHCYQRNRDKYHPYLGYAPSNPRGTVVPAVGASSSPAATGAVGGRVQTK